jgi:hypothetical protein
MPTQMIIPEHKQLYEEVHVLQRALLRRYVVVEPPGPLLERPEVSLYRVPQFERNVKPLQSIPFKGPRIPWAPVHKDYGPVGAHIQDLPDKYHRVDRLPLIRSVYRKELLRVYIDRCPYEDIFLPCSLSLVSSMATILPLLDLRNHALQDMYPIEDGHVACVYHPVWYVIPL